MYYEEKLIDGILHYNSVAPKQSEHWIPFTPEVLSYRVLVAERSLMDVQSQMMTSLSNLAKS